MQGLSGVYALVGPLRYAPDSGHAQRAGRCSLSAKSDRKRCSNQLAPIDQFVGNGRTEVREQLLTLKRPWFAPAAEAKKSPAAAPLAQQ
jgi:hypothetical protein